MRTNSRSLLLICVFVVASLYARAQQDPAPPPGSDGQMNDGSAEAQGPDNRQTMEPDNRPLSGAQDLSPGIPESSRNVFNASVGVQQRLNDTSGANSDQLGAETDALGTLLWNRTWHQNSLQLHYAGGTLFAGSNYFESLHTFDISQTLFFGRWSFNIFNQTTYSPESTFGLPGLQLLSSSFFGTNPTLLANQTVLTGQTSRLSNSTVGQLEYAASRRTALTLTGSYSLLHYTATSLFDNTQEGGTVGYNYLVTPRNTVALTYGYQQFGFKLLGDTVDINSATLGYGRQVLGRFSLQIEGGAQLARSFGPGSLPRNNIRPEARLGLTSVWHRTQFRLSGSKAVVSGGGLSVAMNTTTGSLSAERNLSRTWTSTINVGYAANSLIGLNYKVQSGFAEGHVERTMGQHVRLSVLYNFQKQVGEEECALSLCAGQFLRHSLGIGFTWQFRPIGLR